MKMAIRKLTKKDTTTRLKAVQEFAEICEGIDVEEADEPMDEATRTAAVKTVLPFW
jgi:hypothetical protein